eukprot:PhF_6_TR15964/c0_g1_i1/m.24916
MSHRTKNCKKPLWNLDHPHLCNQSPLWFTGHTCWKLRMEFRRCWTLYVARSLRVGRSRPQARRAFEEEVVRIAVAGTQIIQSQHRTQGIITINMDIIIIHMFRLLIL